MSLTWVFDGLKSEPYGLIPYSSLTGKGNTSVRYTKKLGSYNWLTHDDLLHPTIVVPGEPYQQKAFNGCKMAPDTEDLIFDPNIIGLPRASLDPIFEVLRLTQRQPIDFQQFDVVTDVINLQKLFAFCKGEEDGGLFRIDLERVGKTVLMNRIEGSGFIPADPEFPSYDINLRKSVARARSNATEGPFQQISSYQFGAFNMLVRYQPEFAEFSPGDWLIEPEEVNEDFGKNAEPFPDSDLHFVKFGKKYENSLSLMAAYPEGRGFPNFLWPAVFFSGVDRLMVGYFRGTGEFPKPASHTLSDINRLVKPLPYQTATRLHDLLSKIINFMRSCDGDIKVTLVWQGFPHIEIYERAPLTPPAISRNVRKFLKSQLPEDRISEESDPEQSPEPEPVQAEPHEMNDIDAGRDQGAENANAEENAIIDNNQPNEFGYANDRAGQDGGMGEGQIQEGNVAENVAGVHDPAEPVADDGGEGSDPGRQENAAAEGRRHDEVVDNTDDMENAENELQSDERSQEQEIVQGAETAAVEDKPETTAERSELAEAGSSAEHKPGDGGVENPEQVGSDKTDAHALKSAHGALDQVDE